MDPVDEVKSKVDIVSLIGGYIELKKAGRNYKALCPFHSEKTPSFMVSPELQMYKCFGCGEGGDAFSFLEKYEGMDFGEALRFLAKKVGVKLPAYSGQKASEKEKFYQINSLASRFYNYLLLNHAVGKAALNYLTKERGIPLDAIKTFEIGFAPDVPSALEKFLVGRKKFDIRDLERVGLLVRANGRTFDRFRGRIIFPLYDHKGNVTGFAGRLLPGAKPDLAKYINTPETPIYHKGAMFYGLNLTKQEIKAKNEAVVVEGELDLISSWTHGVANVVAIKGSALTEDQVRLLARFAKKMILALDSDIAGDSAARRGVVVAQNEGFEIRVARFGDYKDPDEAARENPEAFKNALNKAIGVWDFIIDSIFAKGDAQSGEGKAKISREVVPVLDSIPDKIVQAHYVEIVARRLGVPPAAVSEQLTVVEKAKGEGKVEVVTTSKQAEKGRKQLLEERLLTLVFASDPAILLDEKIARLVNTPVCSRLIEEYQVYAKTSAIFNAAEFSSALPKELVSGFAEIILADIENLSEDAAKVKMETNLTLRELKVVNLRHRLEELGVAIRRYEGEKEEKKLRKSQEEFGKLSQKLSSLEQERDGGIILQEGG